LKVCRKNECNVFACSLDIMKVITRLFDGLGLDDFPRVYMKMYNGEFDPGSGRTLAAGLTHAS
jgi:hypothetical protein